MSEPDQGAFRPPRFDALTESGPDGTTLTISGELDLDSEPELSHALELAAGTPTTVDLSGLAFMDSTGLRVLLSAARTYPNVKLQGPLQPPVQRLLELTQTLSILPFRD